MNARELANALQTAEHVNQIKDPKLKALSTEISGRYTLAVDLLKSDHNPNPHIRALARSIYYVVNKKIVLTAAWGGVESLHFAVHGRKDQHVATILIPLNWIESLKKDPVFGVAGIIFTGSQAVDWHKQGQTTPLARGWRDRATAHEAEYLLMVQQDMPEYQFNAYQQEVLAKFPKGLGSFVE